VKRLPLVVGLTLALAACATAPRPPAANRSAPAAVTSDARARVVANALAMIGEPYRYGGAAPGGFDCSGLVVYATGSVGIHLPRTAREQMNAGIPVARGDLRAGDLVFLHLDRKDLHVGIAVDAGRFVHAPATGGSVRIDSLDSPPYAHAFIKARRVIDDAGRTIGR
jgi:cell wall-associated NlpC family hydrolase